MGFPPVQRIYSWKYVVMAIWIPSKQQLWIAYSADVVCLREKKKRHIFSSTKEVKPENKSMCCGMYIIWVIGKLAKTPLWISGFSFWYYSQTLQLCPRHQNSDHWPKHCQSAYFMFQHIDIKCPRLSNLGTKTDQEYILILKSLFYALFPFSLWIAHTYICNVYF